jgi:hypothetical protein
MALDDERAAERVARVETLLDQVESAADPAIRDTAVALLRALLDLYGEGLARIVAAARRTGAPALDVELASDELVSHLLLLHGLHPLDLPTRIGRAVDTVRDRLGGAEPHLVSVDGAVARLLLPAGRGCRGGASALRTTLEEAIRGAAPEIEHVEFDEATPAPAVIPIESLRRRAADGDPDARASR